MVSREFRLGRSKALRFLEELASTEGKAISAYFPSGMARCSVENKLEELSGSICMPPDVVETISSSKMGAAFFSNQQQAINETHRVLKAGARFYIVHLESSKELSKIHRRIGGAVEHDEIPPEDQLRSMLHDSRFTEITVEDHPGLYLAVGVNSE